MRDGEGRERGQEGKGRQRAVSRVFSSGVPGTGFNHLLFQDSDVSEADPMALLESMKVIMVAHTHEHSHAHTLKDVLTKLLTLQDIQVCVFGKLQLCVLLRTWMIWTLTCSNQRRSRVQLQLRALEEPGQSLLNQTQPPGGQVGSESHRPQTARHMMLVMSASCVIDEC